MISANKGLVYTCTKCNNVTHVCILKAFLRHKSVVLPEEKLHFEKLTKEYMTDESDGDSDVIILHKHEWRSNSK